MSSLLSFSFVEDLVHLTSDHRPKLMSSPLSDSERLESKSSPLDALAKGSGTTTPYSDSHCRLSLTFTSREPSLDVPLCFSEESCASHPVCLAGRPEDSGELNASTSDARCSSVGEKTNLDLLIMVLLRRCKTPPPPSRDVLHSPSGNGFQYFR